MAGKKTAMVLRVVAKTEVFRRAGYTFTRDPKDLTTADFEGKDGEAKLKMLLSEPMLFCTEVEIEIPDAGDAPKK